ncbi:MAG TPA: tRNA preQ1(34) S-adenosylmethionine ribosyltransferase-isomerase QueA [Candidatus Dormibacteraeota bacterium]
MSTDAAGTAAETATAAFDYPLAPERIAQRPLAERDASRLLHLPLQGPPEDRGFRELPALLRRGDLLVVNDTRVRAARLAARRPGGGAAELLVLHPLAEGGYACLVRPARRLPEGTRLTIRPRLEAVMGGRVPGHPGARSVRLEAAGGDVDAAIEAAGRVPLPPYIRATLDDPGRYQTVYAAGGPASAAAPTAGLHFTPAVLAALDAAGVERTQVRLEVGLATFAPIRHERVDEHPMHEERYALPAAAAAAVAAARARGGRVIAVGTTAVRVLESRAHDDGTVEAGEGTTRLYLRPGVPVRVVDGLLTNFHQPRSSLLVLLAALIGTERWRAAYDHALGAGYRFLSFGDCMLCWRSPGP